MFQFLQYLKFLYRSTNQHGVHSPFVYDLVTRCFYDKTLFPEYKDLKAYRKDLLRNGNSISITDFGSGSKVFRSNSRTIEDMAKTSGTTFKRAALLYRIVQYLKPGQILELGTSLGIATHAMAIANPNSHILSIEGCQNLSARTREQLSAFGVNNVHITTGDISDVLKTLDSQSFDLIFFDANHTKKATLEYFEVLLKTAHNNSLFIFDDIHWSSGMKAAWNQIQGHPSVTVTIDTFFWGFVFFRREQAKENFNIRM